MSYRTQWESKQLFCCLRVCPNYSKDLKNDPLKHIKAARYYGNWLINGSFTCFLVVIASTGLKKEKCAHLLHVSYYKHTTGKNDAMVKVGWRHSFTVSSETTVVLWYVRQLDKPGSSGIWTRESYPHDGATRHGFPLRSWTKVRFTCSFWGTLVLDTERATTDVWFFIHVRYASRSG